MEERGASKGGDTGGCERKDCIKSKGKKEGEDGNDYELMTSMLTHMLNLQRVESKRGVLSCSAWKLDDSYIHYIRLPRQEWNGTWSLDQSTTPMKL